MKAPVIHLATLQVQDPGDGFIIGVGRIGIDVLTDLPGFTIGTSHLGIDKLGVARAWVDYTGQLTSVTISRGGQLGVAPSVDTGTMQAEFRNAADPRTDPRIRPGRPVRLLDLTHARPVFTGTITDIVAADTPTGYTASIKVSDAIAQHVATTRYGAVVEGGIGHEPWHARIRRLIRSAVVKCVEPDPVDLGWELCDTVYESSLANHFDMACNTVGAAWWVDPENITRFTARMSASPVAAFDEAAYAEIDTGFALDRMANDIEITNHQRAKNPDTGNWEANDVVSHAIDATARATWGACSDSCDISIWPAAAVEARGAELLDEHAIPELGPTRIRVDAIAHPEALTPDILDLVDVTRTDTTWACRVWAINQQLTPTTWAVTLTLDPEGIA
jgi:hypothetical protein